MVIPLCQVKLTFYPVQSRAVLFEKSSYFTFSLSAMVLKVQLLVVDKINMSELKCCMNSIDVSSNL